MTSATPPPDGPPPVAPDMAAGARRILLNVVFRTVADVGSKVASLALYVVMARKLGPAQFGVFTFAMTLMLLVATAARLGQPSVVTREVARDRSRVHEYYANTLALQVAVALPVLIVTLLLGPTLGMDDRTLQVCALLGVAVLLEALIATVFAVMQAFEQLLYMPVVVIAQRFAIAAGGIVALLLGAGVVAVSALYLAGTVLGFALAVVALVRRIVRPRLEVEPRRWGGLLRAAVPVGIAGAFATVLFRVDVAILAALETDAVVGEYGAAYRLFEGTLFFSWALAAAVYPVFSRLSRASQPPVRVVFERATKLGLALCLPFGAGAVVLADPVIQWLYGGAYDEAAGALALLGVGIALFPIGFIGGQLLIAQDRQRELIFINLGLTVMNITGNLLLIPVMSLRGAALVTSLTEVVATGLLLWRGAVACGGIELRRILVGPLLATAAAAASMLALRSLPAAAIAAGAVVFLGVLGMFERRAYPDDARLLAAVLRRRAGSGALAEPAGA